MMAPSFLASSLLVALGGAVGAWLRFAAGRLIGGTVFPCATLSINLLGSLAMGVLAGWLARTGPAGEPLRLLLGLGLLGGFTTFSAFSLELALMLERGALAQAALYAGLSVAGGVAGLFLGLALTRAAA